MRDGWTETTLDQIAEANWGNTSVTKSRYTDRGFTAYSAAGPDGFVDWYEHEGLGVVLSAIGSCGTTWLANGRWTCIKNTIWIKSRTDQVLTRYIYLFSQTPNVFPERGQVQKFISLGDVRRVKVLLPPLEEQRRIVDVVASVDTYIDALKDKVAKARTARNAVLHELLSAGGPDWTETTLGEISELISRGRAPSYCEEGGVMVLNQKCVRGGRIHVEFARLTDVAVKSIPDWAYLKPGDSLINSTGVGTLGRASFVPELGIPATFDSHLTVVRPRSDKCVPSFVGLSLNYREHEIEMFAGGSTGQTELSRDAVRSIPLVLPPLEEQRRIVDIVSSMDDVIAASEKAVAEAVRLRSGLLSDLLSGEHEIPASYDSLLGAA